MLAGGDGLETAALVAEQVKAKVGKTEGVVLVSEDHGLAPAGVALWRHPPWRPPSAGLCCSSRRRSLAGGYGGGDGGAAAHGGCAGADFG